MSLERVAKVLLRKNVRRAAEGDDAAVEQHSVVEVSSYAREVVRGNEQRLALRPQLLKKTKEVVLRGRVEAGERFVQQQKVRLLRESSRYQRPPLLTT